jgi:LmbE family N-acetylglucosaminyl deacetylase
MATVILSPHLDDAVLSCWHLLSGQGELRVVNVFAGVPSGTHGWWDRITGADDSAERVRERRAEDRAALAIAGREATNLDLLDAQYRVNGSEPSAVDAVLPLVEAGDAVWAPAALRPHRDHELVREAGLALREAGHPVCFYADLPSPVPGGPLEFAPDLQAQVHQLDVSQFECKLTAVGCYATQVAALERMAPLTRLRREAVWGP